jgi:hypothetical protein
MIENWYPISIYYYDNIENPDIILQEIKSAENQIEKFYKPNVWSDNVKSTFGTVSNSILKFKLKNLNKFIYSHVVNYIIELDINPVRFYLQDSWFNKIEKHGYQDKHNHSFNTISGCYYYEDSMHQEEGIEFITENKFGMQTIIKYPFYVNRLILFPGMLEHAVKYKKTDGVRKSFSFNFNLEYR